MSSTVCQGLQSCLEPRVLIHRLAPNKPNLEGWSFIQAITNTPHIKNHEIETEQVYVHPLVKSSSSSALSTKSLEMCTESLGSETGSEISESIDEFATMVIEKEKNHGLKRSNSREFTKKVNRSVNFPPPISSIIGSDGVQFKPHREDGRLVLKAVAVSSCNSQFQAERVDGRLKLSFLKETNQENVCNEDSEEEYCDDENDCEDDENDCEDDENDCEDDENGGFWEDDMKIGEFHRLTRCIEGGNGNKVMSNWGTFCIAIS